jgi:hypothetical protein
MIWRVRCITGESKAPMKSLFADIHENQLVDSLFLVAAKNHSVTKGVATAVWFASFS